MLNSNSTNVSVAVADAQEAANSSVDTKLGFKVTKAGREWLDYVSNPLGQKSGGVPKERARPYPDVNSSETTLFVETGAYALTIAATNASCYVGLFGFTGNGESAYILSHTTAATNPLDPTASPDTCTLISSNETAILQAVIGAIGPDVRISGAAIRVVRTSNDTTASGFLTPAWNIMNPVYNTSTYEPYGHTIIRYGDQRYTTSEGCTARMKIYADSTDYNVLPTKIVSTTATAAENPYGEMPGIIISGATVGNTFLITYSCAIEARLPVLTMPFPHSMTFPDPNFDQIRAFVNRCPDSATGNSFRSLFAGLAKGAKKAAGWVWSNRKKIMDFGTKAVGTVMAVRSGGAVGGGGGGNRSRARPNFIGPLRREDQADFIGPRRRPPQRNDSVPPEWRRERPRRKPRERYDDYERNGE
jgi:hypothetical protein